jgi:2-methylcitrate dehydratase PrpD
VDGLSELRPAAARLADFVSTLAYADVPNEVFDAAKLHFLDALGCGLAAHGLSVADHAGRAMAELGGVPEASAIGHPGRLPAPAAAFVNGALGHALDFDDTHPDAICHVSVVVFPAALAAAEAVDATGAELVTALVAGNEVVARIGAAAAPAYMQTGFHPTSVCGVFGAAAAAAKLTGLDAQATAAALGIAGSMASGLFEYLADGSTTKALHAGWAAHAGLFAARLAAHGATGPASVLEGRFGLLRSYFGLDESDLDARLADLGTSWETPRIAFKPYPACHFVHACLDAAAEATAERVLLPEEIESVIVSIPAPGVPLVLEPREDKVAPRTEYDAKFSLQFSIAAMLVNGRVGLDTFAAPMISDPRVLELARRVEYEAKDYESFGTAFPGGVRIVTRTGDKLAAELPYQRGGLQNPMSAGEVRRKFEENATLALPEAAAGTLADVVLALEHELALREAFAVLGDAAGSATARPVSAWSS